MAKFQIIGLVDATCYQEIEAASAEEALEHFDASPSLCHQCSGEMDLGDVYDFQVDDADGETVIKFEQDQKSDLIAALTAELDAARELIELVVFHDGALADEDVEQFRAFLAAGKGGDSG